jgi:hypothetical protein
MCLWSTGKEGKRRKETREKNFVRKERMKTIQKSVTNSLKGTEYCLEANGHSATPEISAFLMESANSLLCSQDHATGSYPEPDASNPHLPTLLP